MKLIFFIILTILGTALIILAAPYDSHSHSNSDSHETDANPSEEVQFNPTTKKQLKVWFKEISKNVQGSPQRSLMYKYTKNVDQNCLNQKLIMAENKNKLVNMAQAATSIGIGYLKCYDKSENSAIIEIINDFLTIYKNVNFNRYGDCYLSELIKLEPTSKLVENFNPEQMKVTKDECNKHLGNDSYEALMNLLEKFTGDLAAFSCGHFVADDFKILEMKLVILSHEKNEELKASEVENLTEVAKTKLNSVFDCVLENF